jgi:hypothetical protein
MPRYQNLASLHVQAGAPVRITSRRAPDLTRSRGIKPNLRLSLPDRMISTRLTAEYCPPGSNVSKPWVEYTAPGGFVSHEIRHAAAARGIPAPARFRTSCFARPSIALRCCTSPAEKVSAPVAFARSRRIGSLRPCALPIGGGAGADQSTAFR